MKMKKCKSCGQMIAKDATKCPNCGHKYKYKNKIGLAIISIAGFLLLVIIVSSIFNQLQQNNSDKKQIVPQTKQQSTTLNENIKTLKENGLLKRINPRFNEAFIESSLWNKLEFNTKENIGRILAFYCGREKGTNLNWVDIKDNYTGKNIAKYSETWGFETY
jgi:hypothetical protein